MTPGYTILSLDGGGIRGIIPSKILVHLEKLVLERLPEEQPHLAEMFDLIAGTSTGGILSCGLAVPGQDGKPKFRAQELLDIYTGDTGKRIFAKPRFGAFASFFRSLNKAKFPRENIEAVLKEYFGETQLSDMLTDLLITSYNTETKKPFYFKSSDYREDPEKENFLITQITRSTSAAPTYFPPNKVPYRGMISMLSRDNKVVNKQLQHLSLIDGGVFANNPSMLAYIEARTRWRDDAWREQQGLTRLVKSRGMQAEVQATDWEVPLLMLSIGTGDPKTPYNYEKVNGWGMVSWVLPLLDILMQGVSETVDYQLQHLLPDYEDGTPRYVRLNIDLEEGHDNMDDPSEENTSRLEDYADRILDRPVNKQRLTQVADLLVQRYLQKARLAPSGV
ncbi:MAG: patatin-like phospholipase family protein [Bacteroidota bacterium]